ncbi:MAG: ribonuclease E/G, partial [Phycisphaerae bacterium]|nr:ribonuclease E/G [Phycisphaerae bacterium]
QESDLVIRTIRDVYNTDIDRIVCDSPAVAKKIQEFLAVVMPRGKHTVDVYTGKEGLFHAYGLEEDIEKIYSRRVELPSGGSLVIDQTEALVAVDVNSGKFRAHRDAESTARNVNIEAAKEIIRQLRLRDLGGVIVIDFIDMREEQNRRAVEKVLKDALKPDRAKTKVLRMSNFGIVEMTRQRMRPSLKDSIYRTCTHCGGSGLVKSEESQALLVMRDLKRVASNDNVASIEVYVTPSVAHHLVNFQRKQIARLETETGKKIVILADGELAGDEVRISCLNSRGTEVTWERKQVPLAPKKDEAAGIVYKDLLGDESTTEASEAGAAGEEPKKKKSRRRGKRGGRRHKKKSAEATSGGEKKQEERS